MSFVCKRVEWCCMVRLSGLLFVLVCVVRVCCVFIVCGVLCDAVGVCCCAIMLRHVCLFVVLRVCVFCD